MSVRRLVVRIGNEPAVPTDVDIDFVFDLDKRTFDGLQRIFNQLCDLTDILGDDYDLDHLRNLVEADRDGRCVVLPDRKQTSDDGENALKSAMNTLYYHNNPVTRYIADAVAEKLTREAAAEALRRKQNE